MNLFEPSREDVRRFFIATWQKVTAQSPLTPMEMLARDRLLEHPEYHNLLAAEEDALTQDFPPEAGRTNPFLHLSLHLAVAEQLQANQPTGLREAYSAMLSQGVCAHDAEHVLLECLAQTLWQSQREQRPPDGADYVACVRKRAKLPPTF